MPLLGLFLFFSEVNPAEGQGVAVKEGPGRIWGQHSLAKTGTDFLTLMPQWRGQNYLGHISRSMWT